MALSPVASRRPACVLHTRHGSASACFAGSDWAQAFSGTPSGWLLCFTHIYRDVKVSGSLYPWASLWTMTFWCRGRNPKLFAFLWNLFWDINSVPELPQGTRLRWDFTWNCTLDWPLSLLCLFLFIQFLLKEEKCPESACMKASQWNTLGNISFIDTR